MSIGLQSSYLISLFGQRSWAGQALPLLWTGFAYREAYNTGSVHTFKEYPLYR